MTTTQDDKTEPKSEEQEPKPEPKSDDKPPVTEKDLTAKIKELIEKALADRGDDDDSNEPPALSNMRSIEQAAENAVRNAITSAGLVKPEDEPEIDIQKQIDDGIKAAMKEFEKQPRKLRRLTKILWGEDE